MNTDWQLPLLWLLLPVAAASGWWWARHGSEKKSVGSLSRIPADYYRGINYFLNEQPDKAIDVFIGMLEIDSDTVEPHLALGNLFRRRGEVDRAIRIHQNLIARPSLSKQHRDQALLELGHDYLLAGLFDRAESLLTELVERDPRNIMALKLLNEIYEQGKEWENAIVTARKRESVTGSRNRTVIAQYYCELADQALADADMVLARKMARRALSQDQGCIRAYILQATIEQRSGQFKAAIRSYKKAMQQAPMYLADIIDGMMDCYRHAGQREEMLKYLREVVLAQGSIIPVLKIIDQFGDDDDGQAAKVRFLSEYLDRHPSLQGLGRYLELMETGREAAQGQLSNARDIISKLLEDSCLFICSNCGLESNIRHWQCPGCRQWMTMVDNSSPGQRKGKVMSYGLGH